MIKKIKLTIIFKVINKNKDFSNSEYFGTVFLKNEMIDIFKKALALKISIMLARIILFK
jgi:hypothetical protein